MLLRLTPIQIGDAWEDIAVSIRTTLPFEPTYTQMENVLTLLLTGVMQCWVEISQQKIIGIITTYIYNDPIFLGRELWILSLYGNGITKDSFNDGYQVLQNFAKESECNMIVAFSDSKEIASLVRAIKGRVRYALTMEVEGCKETQ